MDGTWSGISFNRGGKYDALLGTNKEEKMQQLMCFSPHNFDQSTILAPAFLIGQIALSEEY